jgi:hypothetical protein
MESFFDDLKRDCFCREEAKPMSDFLSSKDLRIHAASNWVIEIDLIENKR